MPEIKSFFSIFKGLDFFGQGLFFYINGNITVKSRFGGFISVCILCLAIYSLIDSLVMWQKNQNLQMVSSSQNLLVSDIVNNNKSFSYELNYSNYAIYFAPSAVIDGNQYNYTYLRKYFYQKLVYTDSNNIEHEVAYERCDFKKRSAFTLLHSDGGTSSLSICPAEEFDIGLYSDPNLGVVNQSILSYRILKCENSTENNNFCASDAEIEDMFQYLTVQVTIPKTSYDFNNPKGHFEAEL